MSDSPTDQMAATSDQSAFACVPRYLVEEYGAILDDTPETATTSQMIDHTDRLNEAAREIADAALDDIA